MSSMICWAELFLALQNIDWRLWQIKDCFKVWTYTLITKWLLFIPFYCFYCLGKMKLKCISYIVDSSEKSVSFDHRFVHCCYFVHVVNTYNVSTWEVILVRKLLGSLSKANWLLREPPHTAEEHVHHSYCVHEYVRDKYVKFILRSD